MSSELRNARKGMAALMVLAFMGAAFAALVPSVAEASEAEPVDLGEGWSLSARFVYAPLPDSPTADTVTWDFGDGSEPVTGNVVEHTFPEPGTYIIKQTATNVVGSSTEWYRMTFHGFPSVTYRMGVEGMDDIVIEQTAYDVSALKPADPVREGYSFGGWFRDTSCTQPYDFNTETVTEPITLYAMWTAEGDVPIIGDVPRLTFVDSDGNIVEVMDITPGWHMALDDLKALFKSDNGKIVFGIYADRGFKTLWNPSDVPQHDTTLYVKYVEDTDVSDWATIGVAVAGLVAIIAAAIMRRPVIIVIAMVLIAGAAALYIGVI